MSRSPLYITVFSYSLGRMFRWWRSAVQKVAPLCISTAKVRRSQQSRAVDPAAVRSQWLRRRYSWLFLAMYKTTKISRPLIAFRYRLESRVKTYFRLTTTIYAYVCSLFYQLLILVHGFGIDWYEPLSIRQHGVVS